MGEFTISQTPLETVQNRVSQRGHFSEFVAGAGATRLKIGPSSVSIGNVDSGSNYILWDGTTLTIAATVNANNVRTSFPQFVQGTTGRITMDLNSNTTASVGMVCVTNGITVEKITMRSGASVNVAGTADIAVYSEDGQTKIIEVTTPSITATYSYYTATVSPAVNLPPGNYYFAILPNGTTDASFVGWKSSLDDDTFSITNGAVVSGSLTVTASTLPSSFNPVSDISYAQHKTPVLRLDNL